MLIICIFEKKIFWNREHLNMMFPSKFSAAEHFALLAETQQSDALEERDSPFFLKKPKYKWSPTEKMKYRWSSTKNKYVLHGR